MNSPAPPRLPTCAVAPRMVFTQACRALFPGDGSMDPQWDGACAGWIALPIVECYLPLRNCSVTGVEGSLLEKAPGAESVQIPSVSGLFENLRSTPSPARLQHHSCVTTPSAADLLRIARAGVPLAQATNRCIDGPHRRGWSFGKLFNMYRRFMRELPIR